MKKVFFVLVSVLSVVSIKTAAARPIVTLEKIEPSSTPPDVVRIAGHSHTCRKEGVTMPQTFERLHEWATRNHVDALGLGSPWSVTNAALTRTYETTARDAYYAGIDREKIAAETAAQSAALIQEANSIPGNQTLFYIDNETPKSRYGHMWYVGFKVCVPNWHDYSQDRAVWYSPLDDTTAETNALTRGPHKRRTYVEVVKEQRAAGALCIWAHPTSWWTTNGDPNGPFVTNIAADMIPQLLIDGFLDGLTVQGYDAYHRDYQALWFSLLDLGYRVPGFAELDISIGHNITGKDTTFFNLVPAADLPRPLALTNIISTLRAARHTMSSGPILFFSVDGQEQGSTLKSIDGMTHTVHVQAFPAPGEKMLSRVELLGRKGEILAVVKDFPGGTITWRVKGDDAGEALVVRAFGEHDADYLYKAQQRVQHCAITNPIWLRTAAFPEPAAIVPRVDHMSNPKVRALMDYLAKGEFRKDFPGCTPGVVPFEAFRIEEFRRALQED